MVEISNGYVRKDKGYWRAVVCYQYGGAQRKVSKSTRVRCHPDRRDASGRITHRDNRGKGAAEEFLRRWRDELEGAAAESDQLRARLMEADEHLRGLAGKLEESRRARDELAARLEDALTEAGRERKSREDSERLVRQLSERLRRYATSGRTCDGADGEEDAITWRAFETDHHPISDAPTPEAADREGAWRLPRLRDKVANSVAASRALRRNDH